MDGLEPADNADDLPTLVYEELHRLARNLFRSQAPGHTLQPTALVHEAYLRLSRGREKTFKDRNHFYAVAARAMRQILVNHSRDRNRLKRGGDRQRVHLDEHMTISTDETPDFEALEESLVALARIDELKSRIVELRYFAGLSVEKTAEVVGLSATTVKNHWALARAWLLQNMSGSTP